VRIWIAGPEGPSHDFELLVAPRLGERISVACDGEVKEGEVASVVWRLRAIDHSRGAAADLALGGDPAGSVILVHVICDPRGEVIHAAFARDEVEVEHIG
jgi:hypothetical protein